MKENKDMNNNQTVTLTKVYNTCLSLFLVAFVAWSVFASQRINVLVSNNVVIDITSLTQIKYILGLSYSAEEAEMLISLRNWARS